MIEEYVNRDHECPICDEDYMTEKQFIEHTIINHPQEYPFLDFYPVYAVCGHNVPVYLKAEREVGPFYIAWDSRDYVERAVPWQLYRHDWEQIDRDNTPFPRFEEA